MVCDCCNRPRHDHFDGNWHVRWASRRKSRHDHAPASNECIDSRQLDTVFVLLQPSSLFEVTQCALKRGSWVRSVFDTQSIYSLTEGMDYNPFRPHWKHRQCGGVVTGVDDVFTCLTCNATGIAVGALLPADVTNSTEYFACNPELEVQLVDPNQSLTAEFVVSADDGRQNRWQVRKKLRRLIR